MNQKTPLSTGAGIVLPWPRHISRQQRLLNVMQRSLPLVSDPFDELGALVGMDGVAVMQQVRQWLMDGTLRRIGPVYAPGALGSSALAALAIREEHVAAAADIVNRFAEVNHNYERHAFGPVSEPWNLWFVVAAPTVAQRDEVLQAIETATLDLQPSRTRPAMLTLPLAREFYCNLAFALDVQPCGAFDPARAPDQARNFVSYTGADALPVKLSARERALVKALDDGLPIDPQPYARLAEKLRQPESLVLDLLRSWSAEGLLRRMSAVVDHHRLGFRHNAMVVFDVPQDQVDVIAHRLCAHPQVHLCYERARDTGWPYNLYAMMFGRTPDETLQAIERIRAERPFEGLACRVMLTRTRFKQTGARYGQSRIRSNRH